MRDCEEIDAEEHMNQPEMEPEDMIRLQAKRNESFWRDRCDKLAKLIDFHYDKRVGLKAEVKRLRFAVEMAKRELEVSGLYPDHPTIEALEAALKETHNEE